MNAVSAGHQLTLNVAKEILLDGGNAFDAGVAAHFAMFITEPCMASAGGGGFALTGTLQGGVSFFDFFCQTPISKKVNSIDFNPIVIDFGTEQETFYIGLGSAAVPGTIAGLFEIHRRHGSMPIEVLLQPAIELAKDGVIIDAFQAQDLKLLSKILGHKPYGRSLFYLDEDILQEGDRLVLPGMVDLLEYLAQEGQVGFYKGEISKSVHADSMEQGGFLRRQDFEKYQVNVSSPFSFPFKEYNILSPNGPGKGGLALGLFMAEYTKNQNIPKAICKSHNAIRDLSAARKTLDSYYPGNNFQIKAATDGYAGTSHFTIIDKNKNAIALTTTIGEGSGYFIPDTDMQLNNMLGEIFLLPQGAHSWLANSRMNSMMTPTFVLNQNQHLVFAGGSGGASRIPFAIGQVLIGILDDGLNLREACYRGRFHFQDNLFQIENGAVWSNPAPNSIFWKDQSLYFGGVHALYLHNKQIQAVGDPRRNGVSEVF